MSDECPPAVRRTDWVEHNQSKFANLLGFLVWLKFGAKVVKWVAVGIAAVAGTATTGVGGAIAAVAVDWALSSLFDWGVEKIGDMIKSAPIPDIGTGSKNVFVNSLNAVRGSEQGGDELNCHAGNKVAQGSEWVSYNKLPASRVGDRTECSGKVVLKPGTVPNVFIGGPPSSYSNKFGVQSFLETVLKVDGWFKKVKPGKNLVETIKNTAPAVGKKLGEMGEKKVLDELWKATNPF